MMILIALNARIVVSLRQATIHRTNALRVETVSLTSQTSRSAVTASRSVVTSSQSAVTVTVRCDTVTVRRDTVYVRVDSPSDCHCRRRRSTVYCLSPCCHGGAGALVAGGSVQRIDVVVDICVSHGLSASLRPSQ